LDHRSKKSVASEMGILRDTLQDYIRRIQSDCGVSKLNVGRPTTLTEEQENELANMLNDMARRLFGLSPRSDRKRKPRNVFHATIITSSPYKKTVENSERRKKRPSSQSTGQKKQVMLLI
jgi:hypothetical protein